ncbi:MAG: DMT family transporter [Dehalococcoidia bacterium]
MGEAAALIAAFSWSASSVAMTSLAARVSPAAISTIRLLIASLAMPVILVAAGQTGDLADAPASAVWAMVGSGILAYAIGDTLYIAALARLGIQRAFTVTMTLFILLSVAGGILLLDERFRWYQVIGALLVGSGILFIVRSRTGASSAAPRLDRVGFLMVAGVGVTWAAATLWLADARAGLGAIPASAIRTPAGAVGMLAFMLVFQPADLKAAVTNRGVVVALASLGMLSTVFGSLLYVYAIGEAGAGRTTVLNATSPLLALPLSVIFLKERVTRRTIAGTALAVGGIVLVVV